MADHDHSYKLLFSHPEMVRDLLQGFVKADWLVELDFDSLEKVSGNYVTDDLTDRASDIVWRARWGKEWIYIYLLIEFQSTIDRYMAVRVLTYLGLLYQDLVRTRQLPADGQLPPVLPIVLYNGSPRWSAAEQVEALIQAGPKGLEPYRPRLRYLLIDEGCYSESELAPLRNLVAALFRLELSHSRTTVDQVLATLVEWLKSPEQQDLSRALAVWVGKVILGKLPGPPVSGVNDLQEMRKMLADRIEEWGEEFKREGLRKGLEEGRQQGQASLLLRQLRKRFGELPEWVPTRLQQANPEQLERWGERLLDVDSLDRLFDPE
jgi:predicted transposase YdaD